MTATRTTDYEAMLSERVAFFGMNGDAENYPAIRRALNAAGPGALDSFYAMIAQTPHLAAKFTSNEHMARARAAQMAHWDYLFSGDVSSEYAKRAHQVGLVHARIGLEPRWYIGGYSRVVGDMIDHMLLSSWMGRIPGLRKVARTIRAMIRAALLDMEMALSAYFDAMNQSRENMMRQFADALESLARGDLTVQLTGVPREYADLAATFNLTVDRLHEDMETVARGADHIHGGAGEIRVASDDFANRTERQSASLEETAAAMNQITMAIQQGAAQAEQVNEVMSNVQREVLDGGSVVASAVEAMDNIHKSSSEIATIVDVIEGIAFQTNLLALNAGVEAARAGDAGQGFAVVASEVRALAQRSSDAAQGIKSLISSSSAHVDSGVALVGRAGDMLKHVVERINGLGETVGTLSQSSINQAETLAQVNAAVNEMDRMTQQNAAMAEQSNAASRTLATEADTLAAMIHRFRLRGGAGGHSKAA